MSTPPKTEIKYLTLPSGPRIFYRTAGLPSKPTLLLLHGFPTSSHQFRNLIPLLSSSYHIVAPDLPGFGFTTFPSSYEHSFANLATTIGEFLDELKITKFAIYIFDYGSPTGLRLALSRPDAVTAIVTQNGNAYVEGFGADFWAPLQKWWSSGSYSSLDKDIVKAAALGFEATKWQYLNGSPDPDAVPPESYYLDQALLERPGNNEIQLQLFYDYRTNLDLYPQFQEFFGKSNVPILAIWGKNDDIFVKAGAEAYRRDSKNVEVHLVNTGHFALERNEEEFAKLMRAFFEKYGIK
jgi:pimeloyl-ACP methyl ester carboxylesterase